MADRNSNYSLDKTSWAPRYIFLILGAFLSIETFLTSMIPMGSAEKFEILLYTFFFDAICIGLYLFSRNYFVGSKFYLPSLMGEVKTLDSANEGSNAALQQVTAGNKKV